MMRSDHVIGQRIMTGEYIRASISITNACLVAGHLRRQETGCVQTE
jgi:hypothetical protein